MSIAPFLLDLQETGEVRVLDEGRSAAEELVGVRDVLATWDREARLEWPGTPPAFDPAVAEWAALLLYRGCQFFVCRGVGAEMVIGTLGLPCPGVRGPSTTYSVDLTLRFLPDLYLMAHGISRQDPLVECLRHLGRTWPLSSVGMNGLDGVGNLTEILAHPSLRQVYVDRIVARQDVGRLALPEVQAAVRTSLGLYVTPQSKIGTELGKGHAVA